MHFAHCESCHRAFVQRQPDCCAFCAATRDDAQPAHAIESMPALQPTAPRGATKLEALARAFAAAIDLAPATQLAELQAALGSAIVRHTDDTACGTTVGQPVSGISAVCESLAHARRARTAASAHASRAPLAPDASRPPHARHAPLAPHTPLAPVTPTDGASTKAAAKAARQLADSSQKLLPPTLPLAAHPSAAPAVSTHWLTAIVSATLDAALVQYTTLRTAHATTVASQDRWPGPRCANAAAA